MSTEELENKKFELDQKVRLEELLIKRQELELKIQEQKKNSKSVFTTLSITIAGGLITLITGIVLKFIDSREATRLEKTKFETSLFLKATETNNFDQFSKMLSVIQSAGIIDIDSIKMREIRKTLFLAQVEKPDTNMLASNTTVEPPPIHGLRPFVETQRPDSVITSSKPNAPDKNPQTQYWTIVAGGDANLEGALYEQKRSLKSGFNDVKINYRQGSYRTCIGKFQSYDSAVSVLFDVKDRINISAYVVRGDNWCSNPQLSKDGTYYECK